MAERSEAAAVCEHGSMACPDCDGVTDEPILAVGICRGCHERKPLVAHGAACAECVAAVREPNLRQTILRVTWDWTGRAADLPDGEEWAYILRMGGLDADHVHVEEDLPTDLPLAPSSGGSSQGGQSNG